MGNSKPFVLDSIISTDNKHWKDQRSDFAFSVTQKNRESYTHLVKEHLIVNQTLWDLSNEGKNEVNINEFLLNETHAQLQLAMFGFSKNLKKIKIKK